MDFFFQHLISGFVFGMLFSFLMIKVSKRQNLIAYKNDRGLHEFPTPTAGGMIFPFVFISSILTELFILKYVNISTDQIIFLFLYVFLFLGFFDDMFNLKALNKLLFQTITSIFIITIYFLYKDLHFSSIEILIFILAFSFLLFSVNTFNFLDGIDGFALSNAFFILIIFYFFSELSVERYFILSLIGSVLALFYFNIMKKIFIGDTGSLYLGSILGLLIIDTIIFENMNKYILIIATSYWFSDVTITFFIRLFLVKKWYGTHNMHPYQNLTKSLKQHKFTTLISILYNFLFLLPLIILTYQHPSFGIYFTVFAYLPSILFCLYYGPLKNLIFDKKTTSNEI